MGGHYDEETGIITEYYPYIEGVELNFKDSCCPEAIFSVCLSGERNPLYPMIDFPGVLHWTPSAPQFLSSQEGVKVEYLEDGDTRWEELVTEKEADEIASRAVYDADDDAHIAVPHTLSVGTSTVWFRVHRHRGYSASVSLDVRFVIEFGNSEECTRFLHEDMRILERRYIFEDTDVAVINDIMRALVPIYDNRLAAEKNATARCFPYSQFVDDLPQPETHLIRHRASNQAYDRPCYLTLDISFYAYVGCSICRVDWGATNSPPISPSHSNTFQSLNNINLNFPSSARDDCRNSNPSSRNSPGTLSFTVEASSIHGLTGTNSVARGNSITIASEHRNVHVNLAGIPGVNVNINFISGDSYFGAISGGNIGGRNNVNTIRMMTPVTSYSPRVLSSSARRHDLPFLQEVDSQAGVGRWVNQRASRPRPY